MFIQHLAVADITYNVGKTGEKSFTPAFEATLKRELNNAEQFAELELIMIQDGKDLEEMAEILVDHRLKFSRTRVMPT